MKDLNKFLWVMVGGAVWDALWAPVEFESIDNFDWVSDYKDGWWLNAWEWTDDTAMALLLADSLIRCKWFNIEDQLENYLKWHKTWYMWLEISQNENEVKFLKWCIIMKCIKIEHL